MWTVDATEYYFWNTENTKTFLVFKVAVEREKRKKVNNFVKDSVIDCGGDDGCCTLHDAMSWDWRHCVNTPKETTRNGRDANSIIIPFIHRECIGVWERHTHTHIAYTDNWIATIEPNPLDFSRILFVFGFFASFFVFANCVLAEWRSDILLHYYVYAYDMYYAARNRFNFYFLNHIASAIRAETIMSDNLYFARTNLTTKIAWNCYYYSQGLCGALCVRKGRNEGYGAR